MALRPLGFLLAALAALHQSLLVESCARNLDRSTRIIKTTTPRVISFKIGEALYLRLESIPSSTTISSSTTTTTPSTSSTSSSSTSSSLKTASAKLVSSITEATERRSTSGSAMYTNRYDHVAIENVLKSPRLLKNFHWCIMGRGPCTSEGSELKRIIPEALKSDCARCTPTQKIQTGKVLLYLIQHRPAWWKELLEKYDPDGSIRRKYEYEMD